MKKLIFQVKDMHCPSCAMRLEALEDELEGIVSINASYAKQVMEIEFDDRLLDQETIVQAVKTAGYTAFPLKP